MQIVMFYHSLISDWNHGNAHFLRGIASDLQARGHNVRVYEPANGWSLTNLLSENGDKPLTGFNMAFPELKPNFYMAETLDLDKVLCGADLVLVHEWNDHHLVARIGQHHSKDGSYLLFFHDTHHRAATDPAAMSNYDLSEYDGVLAFGNIIRDLYLTNGWVRRAWTWHEAADTRIFHPRKSSTPEGDLVWIGNWGDNERNAELNEFLIEPVRLLGLKARVYGVRYPDQVRSALERANIEYCGWAPNYDVPEIFSRYRLTVHVPRRPYVQRLPGIPTIRPFEALACGIPLVCSPWQDSEDLFTPGSDFLIAQDGQQMRHHLSALLNDPALADRLATNGLRTILDRHTCVHRVDELLSICSEVKNEPLEQAVTM